MLKKLKLKFILLSMTSLFILLTVIIAGMNIINYSSVVKEADTILSVLEVNKGIFPDLKPKIGDMPNDRLPPKFSPETPHESRYFSVSWDKDKKIKNVDVSRISAIDKDEAIEIAQNAILNKANSGFINEYRYIIGEDFDGKRITFLDCGRRLDAFYSFFWTSVAIAVIGYIIVFVIIFILSGRIIKPINEAYQKQKQFITDAGHEIKTPLTIIKANADILEMEFTEPNESLIDIKEQTERLKSLTEELVLLSRMEEGGQNKEKIEFPLSEIVEEAATAFKNLILKENKVFICNVEPMLTLNGNDKDIRQLVSIFLDNALKYSNDNGTISIQLKKQNHSIFLSVYNTIDEKINPEQLRQVFDRFYRTDFSRNSETGGHGIGLSIAKAIVMSYGGKIKATANDSKSFTVTVTFPI